MKIPRIFADDSGESFLDWIEIDFFYDEGADPKGPRFRYGDPSNPIPFSDPWTTGQMNFWRFPTNLEPSWRNPPSRVFLVVLSGAIEIEVSTGNKTTVSSGEMALFEDTVGRGHCIGPAGGEGAIGIVLTVDEHSPDRH